MEDKLKKLNDIIPKWFISGWDKFPQIYFRWILKTFPETKYYGIMYRGLRNFEDYDVMIMTEYTKQDVEEYEMLINKKNRTADESERLYFEYFEKPVIGKPNDFKLSKTLLKKSIKKRDKGKYLSWAKHIKGVEFFQAEDYKYHSKEPRDILIIKQKSDGIDLSKIAIYINDKEISDGLKNTNEVVSTLRNDFTIEGVKSVYKDKLIPIAKERGGLIEHSISTNKYWEADGFVKCPLCK